MQIDKAIKVLDKIISDIKSERIDEARTSLIEFLTLNRDIQQNEWNYEYTDKISYLCDILSYTKNKKISVEFIRIIDEKFYEEKTEALYLLKSRILSDTLLDYESALKFINEAIKKYPENPFFLEIKAGVLNWLEKDDEALSIINLAIEIKKHPDFYQVKANSLYALGKYKIALDSIKKAVRIRENPRYYQTYATILQSLEKYEEALVELDKAKTIWEDSDYYCIKANILYDLGKYEEAISNIDMAIGISENPDYYCLKSWIYRHKSKKESKNLIQKAIDISKFGRPYFFYTKSAILKELGFYPEALESIEKAFSLGGSFPIYFELKARILADLKKFDDARNTLETALPFDFTSDQIRSLEAAKKDIEYLEQLNKNVEKSLQIDEKYKEIKTEFDKLKRDIGNEQGRIAYETEKLKKREEFLEDKLYKFNETVNDDLKKIQIRAVEFLGVFTAILAFVVVGKDIVFQYPFWQSMLLMPSFALSLIIFVAGIRFLVDSKDEKRVLKILIVLLGLLVVSALIAHYLDCLKIMPIKSSQNQQTCKPIDNSSLEVNGLKVINYTSINQSQE
jgi:tetratricopeptide (TPR) repeat protein